MPLIEADPAAGLYIHIPFCRAKCTYCDFNSFAGLEPLYGEYVRAVAQELESGPRAELRTVYIGGGTPTVLPLSDLSHLLEAARRGRPLPPGTEVTIEANPGTVDGAVLDGLLSLGVNRLSLGIQSFDDEELQLLGRIHTAAEALAAFQAARDAGLQNISLDLIFGLPGQDLDAWRASLDRALDLGPEHLSLYALSVEPGTRLAASIRQGELPRPDPDLAADMYELAEEACAAAGYQHYEISNWARQDGLRCEHNLIYWRNEAYVGVGAGAHSWARGQRWANVASPSAYVALISRGESPLASSEAIPPELEMGETMMMGLRLLDEGVPFERFRRRFGSDLRQRYAAEIDELDQLGLVEVDEERLRLAPRGRLLANQVFYRFLPL
ncbi:MAG: radical SAM family heme chaperone HemW [Anaerolineae bacterium]|nr:radical SAM family heme chaperone HemW [Anaerolineae bacterium]